MQLILVKPSRNSDFDNNLDTIKAMRLTQTSLAALPAPDKNTLISDDAVTGLYVRLSPSGRKTFVYRVRRQNTWTIRKLGVHPAMTLAKARADAAALHTKTLPDSVTLADVLDEYYRLRVEPNYRQPSQVAGYIAWAKRKMGNVRVHALTTAQMVGHLRDYAKRAPIAANRALAVLKLSLKFAIESGWAERSVLEHTTDRTIGGSEPTRDRVLTDQEIKWIWAQGEEEPARLLRLLLLTGLRKMEGLTGTLEGDTFSIPITKNGKPFTVHLTPFAKAQLGDGFTIQEKTVNGWLTRKLKQEKLPHFVVHDTRRTFATGLASLGCDPIVIEKCLHHALRISGTAEIYNRHQYHPERQAALELWSDHIQKLVGAK